MDAAALEQTLRDHPDDAASWLVYGDWLLEQDDVRGALIQLEQRCVRARAADRAALRREIDALVEQHRAGWSAALPPGVEVKAWRYGFATKVAVTWSEEAPALIERALAERFVTGLRIVSPGSGGEEYGQPDDEYDEDGEPIPPVPLELPGLAALDLRRLVELDLSYVHLGASGAEAIAAQATLGRLEVLDLRYCGVGDAGITALAGAPCLGGMRRLRLQRNGITAVGASALRGFGRLVELDLRYNPIGAEGVQALLDAPFIGSLARLDLYRADVSDAGARELAKSSRLAPALRSLWRSA